MAAGRSLSRLEATLRRIAADLADLGRRWAVVGALAVSARAEPRFTRDIDVAVGVEDDADAERLVHDLQARGYGVASIVEQEATSRLAAARLVPPVEADSGVVLDLLFAVAGIEADLVSAAVALEVLPGLSVPVATTGHLVALKVLARDDRTRPQDRVDLGALARIATAADLEQARSALALIEARGFHRGRDLRRDLDRLLDELGHSG